VCARQHGWWQASPEIEAPGYDPFGPDGANYNLIIGNAAIDPVSGSVPHRAYLCQIYREGKGRKIRELEFMELGMAGALHVHRATHLCMLYGAGLGIDYCRVEGCADPPLLVRPTRGCRGEASGGQMMGFIDVQSPDASPLR